MYALNEVKGMMLKMKKIDNEYTNSVFESIKHIDEFGNEFWYARELQKQKIQIGILGGN